MQSENEAKTPLRYTDSRILIANWNEEKVTKEVNRIGHGPHNGINVGKGNLVSQKTAQVFSYYLKEVQLEVPCDFVRFGAIIQLSIHQPHQLNAPAMPGINPMNRQSLVVSIAMDGVAVNQMDRSNSSCILSLAPSIRPCVRNTFVVTSPDDLDRTNDILKYNQDFSLRCVEGDEMICSTPKMDGTLGSATYCPYKYFKNGEINQSVGLAVRKTDPETAIKPTHFRWKCFNVNPSIRFETEGEAVPSNTELVICHSATNKLLAGEKTLFKGIFGMEYGLSVTTYRTVQKIETFQNIWRIKTKGADVD